MTYFTLFSNNREPAIQRSVRHRSTKEQGSEQISFCLYCFYHYISSSNLRRSKLRSSLEIDHTGTNSHSARPFSATVFSTLLQTTVKPPGKIPRKVFGRLFGLCLEHYPRSYMQPRHSYFLEPTFRDMRGRLGSIGGESGLGQSLMWPAVRGMVQINK